MDTDTCDWRARHRALTAAPSDVQEKHTHECHGPNIMDVGLVTGPTRCIETLREKEERLITSV